MVATKQKLKIFGHVQHVAHQYEMLKLMDHYPVEFYWLRNNVRKWEEVPEADSMHRPLHPNLKWVSYYEPGKYDLAMLHVDQQMINPDIGKGKLYRQLNELIQDIPKVVIQHGSPDYTEMYDEDTVINGADVHKPDGTVEHIMGMKELIGNNFMVVNSYAAVDRWGWGYPVIHGMDADEWWDLPKEPRVMIQLSPGGMDSYNNRQMLSYIKAQVTDRVGLDVMHVTVNIKHDNWDQQRHFLGSSLFALTVAKDSPMPRSRTEAMLSGCCVLSSRYHNADEFIETGVNGFIVPDNPMKYTELIDQLLNHHYKDCVEIGRKGKETAQELFNWERYGKDIWKVLENVANKKPPTQWKKIW